MTNGVATKYYYFGKQRVALRTTAGVTYIHSDHLGSTSVTTNASGQCTSAQWYYAYGNLRTPAPTTPCSGTPAADFGFTGQRSDASSGLMYYGARYYDSALGRFISADTVVPQAGSSQALNRYSYVGNNPLKYTDPSGHCWGVASGARSLPTYDVTCGNLDMALTIIQHPNANAVEKAFAGWYIATEGAAHVAVAVGTGVIAWEAIVPTLTAGGAGAAIAEGACGDGDCTNEAGAIATQLGKVGPNSVETARLADQLARLSTNGSGSRVVLGEYLPGSAGSYEQIAIQRGGVYFQTPNGVYSLLGKFGHSAKDMVWEVNQAFLRQMMERRVAAIDFVNMDIDDVLAQYGRRPIPWDQLTGRMRELFYLLHNAEQYGYERIGNSFVLKQ